tara:strand:- start:142 stop:864 length:723 start_codon:yes stop_codon:yes gene_type:complete
VRTLRSIVVLPQPEASSPPGLEARLKNIDLIEEMATEKGLTLNAAAAMVANAWAESRIESDAHDGGSGWGLFQLTGKDYTPATSSRMRKGSIDQRKDPVHNIAYMLDEMKGVRGYWFRRGDAEGKSPSDLAAIFARDLERCARCGDPYYGLKADGETPKVLHNPHKPPGAAGFSSLEDRAQVARDFFPMLRERGPLLVASPGGSADSPLLSIVMLGALGMVLYNIGAIEDKIQGRSDELW